MKNKLKEILKNPKGKLIAVDLDGTLSEGEWWGLENEPEPKPIQKVIDFVEDLYKRGGHIIIYTARNPKYFIETSAWLLKYNVYYHGIAMQRKCGADLYIDDKALNIEDIIK